MLVQTRDGWKTVTEASLACDAQRRDEIVSRLRRLEQPPDGTIDDDGNIVVTLDPVTTVKFTESEPYY